MFSASRSSPKPTIAQQIRSATHRADPLLHLQVIKGCLGFTSQVIASNAAYAGACASALAPVVILHDLPRPEFDPDTPLPPFLNDFASALEDLGPHVTTTLINVLDPIKLWDVAKDGMQHRVMDQLNDSLRRDLVAGLPASSSLSNRGVRIAVFGQNTPEAGAWITASPFNARCKMSNGSFIEAVRKRLAIPIMAIQPGQACATCTSPLETQERHALNMLPGDRKVQLANANPGCRHSRGQGSIYPLCQNTSDADILASTAPTATC